MTHLEQLIQDLCPNGVKFVKLGEVVSYEQPSKYIVKSTEYDDSYDIPVLTAGQSFILGYTNEKTGIYPASKVSPVVIFDDFTTSMQWVDFPFKVKSSAMKILTSNDRDVALIRYLYYALTTIKYTPDSATHSRQWIGTYANLQIPLPPLAVQSEIVRILDKFTLYKSELAAELAARLQQYEYYRNQLLTFDDSVKRVKLGEVCRFQNGFSFKSTKFLKEGEPILRITNIKDAQIDDSSLVYFSLDDYKENLDAFKVAKDRIVVAMSGATTGKVGINKSDNTYYLNQRVGMFVPDETILNNRYLYHFLLSKSTDLYYMAGGGAQPNLSSKAVCEKLYIYIPSLIEQERIASVLDRLDTLIHDIREGLPAEIALRQKQYEHYRDKLLTFEAKS